MFEGCVGCNSYHTSSLWRENPRSARRLGPGLLYNSQSSRTEMSHEYVADSIPKWLSGTEAHGTALRLKKFSILTQRDISYVVEYYRMLQVNRGLKFPDSPRIPLGINTVYWVISPDTVTARLLKVALSGQD